MNSRGKIGVFDSGFGGLHVLQSVVQTLPQYEYIFLGDNARAPYGTRSSEIIHQFTEDAVRFLLDQGCELVVLACNTVSCDALRMIQQTVLPQIAPQKRVLGVLIPAAEVAAEVTQNGRVGVMATALTVSSGAFIREIHRINPQIQVIQQACPLLVPIVEEGAYPNPGCTYFLHTYLKPLLDQDIDTLILGSTHYGLLASEIRKLVGPRVHVVSQAELVPAKIQQYLAAHPEMETRLTQSGGVTFFSSDLTQKVATLGSTFFGRPIEVKVWSIA
jgi:glutamate racemase